MDERERILLASIRDDLASRIEGEAVLERELPGGHGPGYVAGLNAAAALLDDALAARGLPVGWRP